MSKLFLISGHSGSGKTTVMREIMDNELLSFTTREKRVGEIDGEDYIFISREEYESLYNNNGLVEWTEYAGNYYGITKEELESKLSKGDCFAIVDYNGMKQLKNLYNNTVSIFLYADYTEAKDNMLYRGDSIEKINGRLKTYGREMDNKRHYDYIIKNNHGKLGNTIEIVRNIILSETSI